MKKLITFLFAVMISVIAYADSNSCPVVNGNGANAYLVQTSDQANDFGQVYVYVNVDKEISQNVNVLVNVYDAQTGEKVATAVVYVAGNTRSGYKCVNGLEKNHNYYFEIHRASCR